MDTKAIIIIAVVSASVVVGLIFVYFFFLRNKDHKAKVDEEKIAVKIDNNSWIESLGGRSNIKNVELKGSRLIVGLNDNTLINKDELHDLGASSIIVSEQKVTLVIKEEAEKVANLLK